MRARIHLALFLAMGIHSPALPDEASPGPGGDLATRALELFASQDEEFDTGAVRARIAELVRGARGRLEGLKGGADRIDALNAFFFDEGQFSASMDLRDPDNLFPDRVLERKRGYCTGLALIYAVVAQELGLPVYGVNTPEHLFLRYDDGTERINIETLEGGAQHPDERYVMRFRIPETSRLEGVFLHNLDTDGFLSQLANNLGALRSLDDEFEESERLYLHALELDPQNSTARYNLARDQMHQERFDEALVNFSRALGLNPKSVPAWNNRGVCRASMGDLVNAERDFRGALAIDPAHPGARLNLQRLAAEESTPVAPVD